MVRVTRRAASARLRRSWILIAATMLLVAGQVAPASAQFFTPPMIPTFLVQGEVYAEEHTFQAPSTNILERVVPTTRTVRIPIHRTFPRISSGAPQLFAMGVNWRIGEGPPTSFSVTPKDVEFTSGTVRFAEGESFAEIPVTLKGRPADGRPGSSR